MSRKAIELSAIGALAARAKADAEKAAAAAASGKADKGTTLAAYGITDAATKAELNSVAGSVHRPGGTVADLAALPTPDAAHVGLVYNVTAAFVTTEAFLEGAGKRYGAGSNVSIVVRTPEVPESAEGAGDGQPATYGYDVMGGFVDLSGYVEKETGKGLSTNDYTTEEKEKLADIEFATDAEVEAALDEVFGEEE